jgi:hypothetical protein
MKSKKANLLVGVLIFLLGAFLILFSVAVPAHIWGNWFVDGGPIKSVVATFVMMLFGYFTISLSGAFFRDAFEWKDE